jgi:hypothetical protein
VTVLLPGEAPLSVVRRFVREARALAAAGGHPALPATFECDRLPAGGGFVVTEPIEGEPGDEWLRRAGTLQARPVLAAAILGVVADACAHLARHGVVHGDLRPGSLRLVPDARDPARFAVKLVASEEAAVRAWRLAGGERPAPDARADIHALGRLFFELLTGESPTPAAGPRVPSIPIEMQRLLGRMLAEAPSARHQSMEEIVTALELILGRHRSRFAELLRAPEACPGRPAPGAEALSPDLTPLAPALSGEPAAAFVAGSLARLRGAGAAALCAAAEWLQAARRRLSPGPAGAPTVLVAEDDEDTRESLVELLEDNGYRVLAARHGLEAQDYLRNGERAECMVMDLWMPEMDGWTLAAEMKQGRLPAVPTIVMTAAPPHVGYPGPIVVRKPFDSDHLLGLIRSMTG